MLWLPLIAVKRVFQISSTLNDKVLSPHFVFVMRVFKRNLFQTLMAEMDSSAVRDQQGIECIELNTLHVMLNSVYELIP